MLLIKAGGGRAINLTGLAADLASLTEPFVLLHGANAKRDDLAARLGIEVKRLVSVSGVASVESDDDLIDLMMMSYAGLQNKRIVELLQIRGVNAVGLCGLDGGLVRGRRNQGIRVRRGEKTLIVRDRSGKGEAVNGSLLRLLIDNGYAPVVTVPILDETNRAVNTENDDLLPLFQGEIGAETVVLLLEEKGFLRDGSDPGSFVPQMNRDDLEQWEKTATGRIKRKLRGIQKLLEAGVPRVIIADGRVDHPLAEALAGQGTVIQ